MPSTIMPLTTSAAMPTMTTSTTSSGSVGGDRRSAYRRAPGCGRLHPHADRLAKRIGSRPQGLRAGHADDGDVGLGRVPRRR